MQEHIQEYYDNSAYSDVHVQLNDGLLHAHKLVLSRIGFFATLFASPLAHVINGVTIVSFPDHSDDTVIAMIQIIYGVITCKDVPDLWNRLFPLAHFISATDIMSELSACAKATPYTIVSYAYLYDFSKLLVDNFALIKSVRGFSQQLYEYFRGIWLKHDQSHATLFALDCEFVSSDKIELLNTYAASYVIDNTFLDQFPVIDENIIKTVPLIKMIVNLAAVRNNTCWYTLDAI